MNPQNVVRESYAVVKTESRDLLILLLLLVSSRILLYEVTGYTADDAFITYRYAENLASGKGFVFNAGEKVQGTSSPLYVLVLASFGELFGSAAIPVASRLFSLAMDVVSLIFLWHLLSSFNNLTRFLACLLFAVYPKVVLIGISGMEASTAVMLMLASLYSLRNGQVTATFILFGLLFLCRIDSVLWIALCVLWQLWTMKRLALRPFLWTGAVYAPWVFFSIYYFGSWVPHAVVAKRISWDHLFPSFDPLRILLGYFPFQALQGFLAGFQLFLIILFLIPVLWGFIHAVRSKNLLVIFPSFFLTYNLAFSFGRVVMADWYYLPGYVSYFVTLGYLLDHLQSRFAALANRRLAERFLKTSAIIVLVLLLFVGVVRWTKNPGGLFLRQNKGLGVWLRKHASPGAHVLLEPIGVVGWESKLYIDDYIGLVSPEVLSYRKRFPNSDAWFGNYIKAKQPEFIVLRNWEVPRNALFHGYGDGLFRNDEDKKWFHSTYTEVIWNPQPAIRDSVYLVLYLHVPKREGVKEKEK